MSCDCCAPVAYSWHTHGYFWVSDSYYSGNYGFGSTSFGYGRNPKSFLGHPPLIGCGGTTIPRDSDWIFISTCTTRGYGILADGSLWGWGSGPLGDGTMNNYSRATKISSESWKYVSTSDTHTLAIKQDGSLWGWGSNVNGYLGTGNATHAADNQPAINFSGRAVLNASMESIDTSDFQEAVSFPSYVNQSNMQPQQVFFRRGSSAVSGSAAANATITYGITSVDWYGYLGNRLSSATVTFTTDSRDAGAEPASATVVDYFGMSRINVTSPGRYKYAPTITLSYVEENSSTTSIAIKANYRSVEIQASLISGGTGYTHTETSKIQAVATFANNGSVQIGNVNLAPSSVARVEGGLPYQWLRYSTGRVVTPSLSVAGGLQSAPPRAYLISPTDGTVELSVVVNSSMPFGGQYISYTIPPQTFYGRQSPGFIRVTFDTDIRPAQTPPPGRTNTPSSIVTTDGFLMVSGNPPVPYATSGRWSVGDYLGNSFFINYIGQPDGGATVLKCNSPYTEEYAPLVATKTYIDSVNKIGEGEQYSGGKPNRPLLLSTAYGWTSSATQFSDVPEYLSQANSPATVSDYDLSHSLHRPPSSPVQPTIFIEPTDGVGSGLSLSAVFTEFTDYNTFSGIDRGYDVSFSVDNGGSGYIYEPVVYATFQTVSPTRVGSESDWTSVLAVAGEGSAGLKSDGWPMAWGHSFNASYSPRRVGFSLDVKTVGNAPLTAPNYNTLPYQQTLLLTPDTVGPYPNTTQYYSSSSNLIDDSVLSGDGGWRSNAVMQLRGYNSSSLYSDFSFRSIYGPWLSKYFGLSKGVYKATLPTDAATLKLFPPTGRDKYSVFVPPVYPDDLFKPFRLNESGESNQFGSCYTSAPDLGSNFSCTLIAPSFCKKLSFQDGRLLATDQNNELWYLLGDSTDLTNPTLFYTYQQNRMAIAPVQLETTTITGLSVSAEATWKWSVEEQETTVWSGGQYAFGIQPAPVDSLVQKYMGSPTQEVSIKTAEYKNIIEVLPYRKWTVAITNPGSGYKPGDAISITATGIQSAGFKNNSSFTLDSVEPQEVEMEQLKWDYTWTGYSPNPRLSTIAGSADPWISKPPTVILGGAKEGGYVTKVSEVQTVNTTVQVAKEAKFKLTDEWYPVLVDYSDISFNNFYSETGMYQNPIPQVTVADGGLYATSIPILESSYLTSGKAFLVGTEVKTDGYYASLDVERRLLTRVPDLIVTGGSGSGAAAALVPVDGTGTRRGPYKITRAVTALRGAILDATPTYAISTSGSLISVKNPLVNVPASYPSNFTSFTSHIGQTSSADLYLSTRYGASSGVVGQALDLGQPTAQLNLEVVINDPGSEYQLPPVISVSQPNSEIAVVDAEINGQLVALGVEHAGSGYRSPPTLTISGGGGSGATAAAVISGPIDSVTVASGGSGYAAIPFVHVNGIGTGGKVSVAMAGGVSRIDVSDGGSNYSAAPVVTISGDGTGATATATIKKRVSSIRILARVGRYKAVPSVTISGGGGSGAVAEVETAFSPDSETYYVTGIRVTDQGEGYTSTATVEVSTEDGVSVTASAVMDGYVDSVTLTNSGSGYSTPPVVLLAGTASASAFLSLHVDSLSLTSGGNYRSPPSISFEPVFTVESITLSNPGASYKTPPDVRIVCPRGVGSGASAKCQIGSDGTIKKITLTARGSGYVPSAPPVVMFFGGDGIGATATVSVSALGSGGSGATTINGSILYAKVMQPGSNYQFSPSVSISGGGNAGVTKLQNDLSSGAITADEYAEAMLATQGRIQARIEGPISRLNIINAGDRYRKPTPSDYLSGQWKRLSDNVSLNGIYSVGYVVGVDGGCELITFNAPDDYPGGPISLPDSLPTTKYQQKPQIRFYNSVGIDVQDYRAEYRTAAGMAKVQTLNGPSAGSWYDRTGTLAYTISAGLSVNGGALTLPWSLDGEEFRISGTGLSGFKFDEAPRLTYEGEGGYGAVLSSQLGEDGPVTGTSFTQTGSGYSIQSKLQMTRGVLRITPCVASCTVSAGGVVSSISINDPGDGYMNPVVFIHGGGGFGATATAIRQTRSGAWYGSGTKTGGIISITLTSGGSGYSASNPPQVFVCDATGYFSDAPLGIKVAESLNSVVNNARSVVWSSEQSEYARPISHEYVDRRNYQHSPWFGSSQDSTISWNYGYSVDKDHSFLAIQDGNASEYVRYFGYADLVSNVFVGCDTMLMRRPYSSPPQISVAGTCKRQLSLSSALAKWGSVSVSGSVVSAIRTDR
jgi:hypothetical protein